MLGRRSVGFVYRGARSMREFRFFYDESFFLARGIVPTAINNRHFYDGSLRDCPDAHAMKLSFFFDCLAASIPQGCCDGVLAEV